MSMPTTDGMANSVMSRGMEAVPMRSTFSSPAEWPRSASPRSSSAASSSGRPAPPSVAAAPASEPAATGVRSVGVTGSLGSLCFDSSMGLVPFLKKRRAPL